MNMNDAFLGSLIFNRNGGGGGGGAQVALTQAEYDALVQAGTVDPTTEYFITDGIPSSIEYYHNYSTDEHIVGAWLDGSPIYERTIVLPNKATAASLSLLISDTDLSALNIVSSNVIGVESIARSVNASIRVEFIDNTYTKGNYESGLTLSFTNGSLYYQCRYANSVSNFDLYLTFRYTKST